VKLAWLFPGQGAQVVGMGRDVCEGSPAARAVFESADDALGEPLSQLCFEGPLETLTLTANTQPAVLTASSAVLAALRERFGVLPEPICAAGHSLGEYSALVAAGSLDLRAAVRVCRQRGRAMQEAVPAGEGAMSAIMGVDGTAVAEACAQAGAATEVVGPANFNAPMQTVIAGHAAAVARASVLARARGAKVIPLKVSAPFHCPLMASARERLAVALRDVEIRPPRFPVIANVDAEAKPQPDDIRQALVEQVDQPVQWLSTVKKMAAMGVTHALELGPGRVLAGLVKRGARGVRVLSVDSMGAIEKVPEFLELEP
jgi:[acyl-carrier-protein] S-malonyltransferase